MLSLFKIFNMMLAQFTNIYLLNYQTTIEYSIIHFVALEVIVHFTHLYLESLMDDPICEVMHHLPEAEVRGCDINFSERTCFHKFARVLYKVIRCLYISFVFYFAPYMILVIFWSTPATADTSGGH